MGTEGAIAMQNREIESENEFLDEDSLEYRKETVEAKRARKKKSKGYFYGGLVTGMAVALLIICVVQLAVKIEQRVNRLSAVGDQSAVADDGVIDKIQLVEDVIRYYYYKDEDIDDKALEEGIYRGMVASLGDPYSEYYSQEELTEMMDQTEGIYYGIGAGVNIDELTSYPKIAKVYSGTPAEEAGLRENDIIYEVDEISTYGMSTTDVVAMIKGEENTSVVLTIYREGESDYLHIEVQRRQVNIPTVESYMMDGGKAYIQITEFDDVTVTQFETALSEARENGMKGLILDLRSNPGGKLDAVVKISQKLLPKGMIVYTEDKYGRRSEYTCDGQHELEVPLVVLINGNSASASEILAGAVKDYGIGTLVGTTTYGKGIVQSIIPLSDQSAVKVTVSRYYTPNGNNIHGIGISPDVECVFDGEAYYGDPSRPDNQLDEAEKILQELMDGVR